MLKKLVGNSSLYLIASMLNRGIAFLLLPIYTSYLLPADYGIIAVCTAVIYALSPILTFDLSGAVNLLYFKLEGQEYKSLLGSVWLWYLIFPLLLTVCFEIFGALFAETFFPSIAWHPYLRFAVWIGFLNVAQQLPLAIYYAEQKAAHYAFLTVAFFLINTGFLLYFLVVREAGALGSLQAQAIALLIATLVSHVIVLRRFGSLREITFSRKHLRMALRLCVPTIPYTLSAWAINLSDRWVLGYFVSTAEIGVYSLAYTFGMLISTVGLALSSAFSPIYYRQHNDPSYRARLPQLISFYLITVTLATLTISLLSPEILRIMANPAYHEAWKFVPVIAGGYWAYAGIYLLSLMVIQNTGRTQWIIVLAAPPAVINIWLNWLLVPRFGIWVAALTTFLAYFLMAIIAYAVSRRMDKLPYSWASLGLIIITAVSAYFTGILWFTFENLALALFAKGFLIILAAGLMLLGSGFDFRQARSLFAKQDSTLPSQT